MEVLNSISIKGLRVKLGLTQEEFAHRLGMTVATVNRWENGHNSPTRLAKKALLSLVEGSSSPTSESRPQA